MKVLILNTLSENDERVKQFIHSIDEKCDCMVFHTESMNIHPCVGCNFCWLKTPGICSIKDDYEKILIKILEHDKLILVSDIKNGMVSYKTKNLLDRILPLATMYLKFGKDKLMHHVPRYECNFRIGLLYTDENDKKVADKEFLNYWLDRVANNFEGKSVGAFHMKEMEVAIDAFSNN